MKSNGLILICDLLLQFLPYFLNTGIQIWNAVEVDILTKSCGEEAVYYEEEYERGDVYSQNSSRKK